VRAPGPADALLPRLTATRAVESDTQPFVLEVEWQLGWRDLSWERMAGVLILAALTFWVVMAYARAYHRQEITRLAAADHLFELANYDSLTGLANRNLLLDRLGHALARARREGHPLVVLFLDLDGFKKVNDSLGHRVGDRVLQLAAERLQASLREADTLARRSGDEFLAILEHLSGGTGLTVVVGKIREAFESPFEVDGRSLALGVSVGAARYPEDARTAEGLLEFADAAMYRDKRRPRAAAAGPDTPAGRTAAGWPAATASPANPA
jgi:diguanylate cyclase (GGDEF)-like protein